MTNMLFQADQDAWDQFAAAALTASLPGSKSLAQAAVVAADAADELLKQRKLRQEAATTYLTGGTTGL